MLFEHVARRLHPRQRVEQMLRPDLARAVKQRGIVGAVAAGENRWIDRDGRAAPGVGMRPEAWRIVSVRMRSCEARQ